MTFKPASKVKVESNRFKYEWGVIDRVNEKKKRNKIRESGDAQRRTKRHTQKKRKIHTQWQRDE